MYIKRQVPYFSKEAHCLLGKIVPTNTKRGKVIALKALGSFCIQKFRPHRLFVIGCLEPLDEHASRILQMGGRSIIALAVLLNLQRAISVLWAINRGRRQRIGKHAVSHDVLSREDLRKLLQFQQCKQ